MLTPSFKLYATTLLISTQMSFNNTRKSLIVWDWVKSQSSYKLTSSFCCLCLKMVWLSLPRVHRIDYLCLRNNYQLFEYYSLCMWWWVCWHRQCCTWPTHIAWSISSIGHHCQLELVSGHEQFRHEDQCHHHHQLCCWSCLYGTLASDWRCW